jgi:hypothetical protein
VLAVKSKSLWTISSSFLGAIGLGAVHDLKGVVESGATLLGAISNPSAFGSLASVTTGAVVVTWLVGRVFASPSPALTPADTPPLDINKSPSDHVIKLRFAGFGIAAAPENPNVRGHKTSREARETRNVGRTLYCEWHVKLQPHQNRIHFHKPVPESCNKIIIGMIHEHLSLPG